MPANVDGMVREGISALRSGRKEEARTLLLRAVENDQYHEEAWLWLSAVVDTPEEQRTCLENVLAINPNNEKAKQGLSVLNQKLGSAKSGSSASEDPFATVNFSSNTPPPAKAVPPKKITDEFPTSIEWEADAPPTSSSSSSRRVKEPSPDDLDNWVSNLNLGTSKGASNIFSPDELEAAAAQFATLPDDDDDDDILNLRAPVQDDDDDFTSGPFDAPVDTSFSEFRNTPAPPPPTPAASPAAVSRQAPVQESDFLLDDIAAETTYPATKSSPGRRRDFEEVGEMEYDDADYFLNIPKEITPTRLPGTREGSPVLPLLGVLLLLIVNIGALVFFVQQMTTAN